MTVLRSAAGSRWSVTISRHPAWQMGAFRVTLQGAGLAFPPQVGAGCVSGREGLTTDPGSGTAEDPDSIGFAVPDMRLRRVARLNSKKNTGVQT